jgi:preprotein translocase subunit SecA
MLQEYSLKETQLTERGFDDDELRKVERHIMLQVLDRHWKDHLASMDQLRQGIHLRGYAQKNPKQEYKREAFELFQHMMNQIQHQLISILHTLELRRDDELEQMEKQRAEEARRQAERMQTMMPPVAEEGLAAAEGQQAEAGQQPVVRDMPKVGRNEPCPCGSGKKFKQCHGKLA